MWCNIPMLGPGQFYSKIFMLRVKFISNIYKVAINIEGIQTKAENKFWT